MTRQPHELAPRRARRVSAAKLAANRANAKQSTGPKSSAGKQRSSRNALSHGLSAAFFADPSRSAQVEELARRIAGDGSDPDQLALARLVAEAQIDLNRVREARIRYLERYIDNPQYESPKTLRQLLERSHVLQQIIDHEGKAAIRKWEKQIFSTQDGPTMHADTRAEKESDNDAASETSERLPLSLEVASRIPDVDLTRKPLSEVERTAAVIEDFAREIARLDRYEARALGRRKMAIRAFDAATKGK